MPKVTVKLSQSYSNPHEGGVLFDTVELREPRYKDIFMDGLGEPQEYQPNGRGGAVLVTHYETIAKYIDRLAVKPTSDLLGQVSAIDALRLQKAVLGFFTEQPTPSGSPDGSSSASVSQPT
jgi:hypothetical protein